jgi:hypothetical protein
MIVVAEVTFEDWTVNMGFCRIWNSENATSDNIQLKSVLETTEAELSCRHTDSLRAGFSSRDSLAVGRWEGGWDEFALDILASQGPLARRTGNQTLK